MENSDACPLINEYKQKFIASRILQTVSGGIRFYNVSTPAIIGQLVVFFFPIILTIIVNVASDESSKYYTTLGVCMLVLLFVGFVNWARDRGEAPSVDQKRTILSMLEEEDQIEIDSFFSFKHFQFLIPQKSVPFKVIDSLLYAILLFLGTLSLHSSALPDSEYNVYAILYIFTSLSLCTGLYCLLSNPAPEVATYQSNTPIKHLYRPFYLIVLCAVLIGYPSYPISIVLSSLVFVFPMGILPPPECLIHWIVELVLTLGLGSSPHPSALVCCIRLAVTAAATYGIISLGGSFGIHTFLTTLASFILLSLPCPLSLTDVRGFLKSWRLWISFVLEVLVLGMIFILPSTAEERTAVVTGDPMGWIQVFLITLACLTTLWDIFSSQFILRVLSNPLIGAVPKLGRKIPYVILTHISKPLLFYFVFSSVEEMDWTETILLLRISTRIWLDPKTTLQSTLLTILTFGDDLLPPGDITIPYLMTFYDVIIVIGVEFLDRLEFFLRLHWDFLFLKKQRRSSWIWITLLNVICLPLTLSLLLLSAILHCELLPLFTLPLLLPSFPRPANFWPVNCSGHTSDSPDGAYYRNFGPKLASALTELIEYRGGSSKPLLCRVENLLLLVQPVSRALGGSSFVLRGLELKETSCHTEEANVVKEIFEGRSEKERSWLNPAPDHILQPITRLEVETYSDARNVLTGILDSPSCLAKIGECFSKVLVHALIQKGVVGRIELEESQPVLTTAGFDFSGISRQSPAAAAANPSPVNQDRVFQKSNDPIDELSFVSSEESWDGTVAFVNNAARSSDSSKKSEQYEIPPAAALYKLPLSSSELDRLAGTNFSAEFYTQCGGRKEEMALVRGIVVCARQAVTSTTAHQTLKSFQGDLEWSKWSEWLKRNDEVLAVVLPAFRQAVKLAIDEMVYGEAESGEEVLDNLKELHRDWFVGREEDPGWSEGILAGRKHLFSLYLNEDSVYSSRTLSLQRLPVEVGEVNRTAVRALWTSLAFELYYLTNDDEERYSIQAHPKILRNILVQSADVPLGYPLYQSPVITLPHL